MKRIRRLTRDQFLRRQKWLKLSSDYAPAKPGVLYNVIRHGRDWFALRVKGRPLCVPSYLCICPWEESR